LRFNKTAPVNQIEAHPEVEHVTVVDDRILQIEIKGSPSQDHLDTLKNRLLAESEANNWGMVEIYDVQNTLQNIFVNEVLRDKQ
jgi:hypothetical protein